MMAEDRAAGGSAVWGVTRGVRRAVQNLFARAGDSGRLGNMGAKYLPTIRDLKASQRFLLKQTGLPKLKTASAKKTKKK
jgi:hypothetical protein